MNDKGKIELISHKLARARGTLAEAELLLNNNFFNAAVNRLYYACFYAVGALLISKDIGARKHSGVIQMFGLHFISTGIISKETGRLYTELFDMRQSGDYEDMIYFIESEVASLLLPAKHLVFEIEAILSKQSDG